MPKIEEAKAKYSQERERAMERRAALQQELLQVERQVIALSGAIEALEQLLQEEAEHDADPGR